MYKFNEKGESQTLKLDFTQLNTRENERQKKKGINLLL